MMNLNLFRLLTILTCVASAAAFADVLILNNGESLSGQTNRIDEGVLVFKTSLAGQMMVPMDTIRSLSTDANFILTLKNKHILYGRLAEKNAQPRLKPIDGGALIPIELDQITEAMPIPSPPQAALDSPGGMTEWKTTLETGFVQHTGNKTYGGAFIQAETSRKSPDTLFQSKLMLERADADQFPRLFQGEAEFRGTGDEPLQPFAALHAERNTANALDLRTGLTLGLNYAVPSINNQTLEARIGIDTVYEEWDASSTAAYTLGRDLTKTGTGLDLHLGLRYARALWGNTEFTSGITLWPALSEPGDFRAQSETALMFPMTKQLRLRLNLLVDYNNAPEFRHLDRWGASVGAGINVSF